MLPVSEKRLRANRANAARSTGPVTAGGKARVASNAMRHGFLAKQILIGNESAENFQTLCDMIVRRFEPVDDFEFNLVEELAASYWRLRRSWALETEMFENAMQKQPARRQIARMDAAFGELAAQPKLALLHRYEARLHLMYQRALRNLLLLRQMGGRREVSAPVPPPIDLPVDASNQPTAPGQGEPTAPNQNESSKAGLPACPSNQQTPELPNKPITPNPCNKFPTRTPAKPPQNTPNPAPTRPQHVKLLTGT